MYGFEKAHYLTIAIEQIGKEDNQDVRRLFHELARHLEHIEIRYV
jgi:hypothetical protein